MIFQEETRLKIKKVT